MGDVLRELVLPKLEAVRASGGSFSARCPAHDDTKPSLSLSAGKQQPIVMYCQAGCETDAILAAIGLTWEDLCKPRDDDDRPRGEWTPAGEATAVYDYRDETGDLLFQVLRTADKQFRQRRPDPSAKSGWAWRLGDARRVLYRLPKVIAAVADGKVIYVVEGERDVHTLEAQHLVATCNPGGAGKFKPEFAEVLRDANVAIIADKDGPGQAHARQVAAMLDGIAATVKTYEPAVGKDATDHFNAGRKLYELVLTSDNAEPAKADLAPDLWEFIGVEDPPYDWVVPGLLERGDRLVWTGFEGLGKSMFTRQLAVCTAAGMDPFLLEDMPQKRVLMIDCENSERQSRRKFRPLAAASIKCQHRVPEGALRLIHRPAGIDLTRSDDAAWLLERVTAHQPDLLIVGPFYRLHAADMNDERAARKVVGILDEARTRADCAMVIEAHAGHGEAGKNRSLRPTGSSLLLRWPEFGYGIAPDPDRLPEAGQPCRDVVVKPWRGARDERTWPTRLTWGDPDGWPWQIAPDADGW
jgi:5S rRNA maturation endonuclease (ribonuclease M5)